MYFSKKDHLDKDMPGTGRVAPDYSAGTWKEKVKPT